MDYKKVCENVINENSDMAFAGVVCGNNAGEILLDDSLNPTVCLVWSDYLEGFNIMGIKGVCPDEIKWISFVRETILSFLKERGMGHCELSCEREEWSPLVLKAFFDYQVNQEKQLVYYSKGGYKPNENICRSSGVEETKQW